LVSNVLAAENARSESEDVAVTFVRAFFNLNSQGLNTPMAWTILSYPERSYNFEQNYVRKYCPDAK
jgi:hypothetical protein